MAMMQEYGGLGGSSLAERGPGPPVLGWAGWCRLPQLMLADGRGPHGAGAEAVSCCSDSRDRAAKWAH